MDELQRLADVYRLRSIELSSVKSKLDVLMDLEQIGIRGSCRSC